MNSDFPLVSVITVTYNLEKAGRIDSFIECINSVHSQTYPNIEHIVIDGASTDATMDCIRRFYDKGWITYISEPDCGIYDAMNKGLKKATGKYVAFLNSDDLWHDSRGIEKTVKALEQARGDLSCGPVKMLSEQGDFLFYWGAIPAIFVSRVCFNHQSCLARTELLRKLGGFDVSSFKIVADYDLISRALLQGAKPVYVHHCFTTFRLGGVSCNQEAFLKEMQKAHKKNFGWIVKDEDIPQMYQGIIPLPLYHAVLSMVHPSVAMELQGISKRKSDGYAFIQVDQPRALTAEAVINEDCSYTLWKQPEETMSTRELSQKSDIKLFDCFPLIRKVVRSHRTDYKLFNLIPIVKLSHKGIKFKCTLFGLIPLFSSIKKN